MEMPAIKKRFASSALDPKEVPDRMVVHFRTQCYRKHPLAAQRLGGWFAVGGLHGHRLNKVAPARTTINVGAATGQRPCSGKDGDTDGETEDTAPRRPNRRGQARRIRQRPERREADPAENG